MMDKHHIIYKTTNLLNGRYYIGMHVTTNIDDGYLGSGRRIKAEIKKYGRENFVREVLDHLPSQVELAIREASLVTEELRSDPLCLNLKNGGEGGGRIWSAEHQRKFKAGADKSRIKIIQSLNARMTVDDRRNASKKRIETQREKGTLGQGFKGRTHSAETKAKISARRKQDS